MDGRGADILADRLEQAFRGSRYHSFLTSLKGVDEEDARWLPPGYRGFPHMDGSILSLAYHVAGDKFVLVSCSFGDGSVTWDEMAERFTAMGASLAAARSLAQDGHALVLSTLKAYDQRGLDELRPYYDGKTYAAHELFSIIAEHDLYHAGQINYVRNLLAGRDVGKRA